MDDRTLRVPSDGEPEHPDIAVRRAVHRPAVHLLFDAYLAGDIGVEDAVAAIKRHVNAIVKPPRQP